MNTYMWTHFVVMYTIAIGVFTWSLQVLVNVRFFLFYSRKSKNVFYQLLSRWKTVQLHKLNMLRVIGSKVAEATESRLEEIVMRSSYIIVNYSCRHVPTPRGYYYLQWMALNLWVHLCIYVGRKTWTSGYYRPSCSQFLNGLTAPLFFRRR